MTRQEWLWCLGIGLLGGVVFAYWFAVYFTAWLFNTVLSLEG